MFKGQAVQDEHHKVGPTIGFPQASVANYQFPLRNIHEVQRS